MNRHHEDHWPELYRALVTPRMIEERMLILLRQGGISKWFSGIGQEAVSVGVTWALEPTDYILPMHRNLGIFTTRGIDLDRLFAQLLGKAEGFTQGRDRSFHFGHLPDHIVGMISHLGAMLPVGCGLALGAQLNQTERVAVNIVGDGATSEGDVHEALNLAAVWQLPMVVVIENNQYGLSTPTREQYACEHLSDRALGYGMPGEQVDGNDVLAVIAAMERALLHARTGQGPYLLECLTFRMRGHEEASGVAYVPDTLITEWSRKDPIERFEAHLIDEGVMDRKSMDDLKSSLHDEIRDRIDRVLAWADPTPDTSRELSDVYAPSAGPFAGEPTGQPVELRYVDAIALGLRRQMERDEKTILLGQDIAEYGGVFKVTDGLLDAFGSRRVRNTPIIESGVIGAALGLALDGFRPMVEMQFADFISSGFNQIVNNLAKTHYRWGAAVPVVIRAPYGGGVGAGPFHSQSIESWFTCVPGLKVVAPATVEDAKLLLLSAFQDDNPVLFLEHKKLYRSVQGMTLAHYETEPLGRAEVRRQGTDLTICAYGWGVHHALDMAQTWSLDGWAIEVVDLRTLYPWDRETVFDSVRKTGKILVLQEAALTGGFGGEIAAAVADHCFEWLDAPVRRVAALDTPIPFHPDLEANYLPFDRLHGEIEALLQY